MQRNVKWRIFSLAPQFLMPVLIVLILCGTVFSQQGYRFGNINPETDRSENLIPWETYGRFGWQSVRGPMIRNYPNSRFSQNGALYDSRGRWIGTMGNAPTSRFKNYGMERQLENEMFFDNMLAQPETPQMSHRAPATPSRQPASTLTADQVIPRYIATPQPHNQLAEITLNAAAAQQQFQQAQQVQPQQQQQELQRPGANRQSQWFRGGPPSAGPPRSAPNQRPGAVPTPGTPVSGFRPVGSEQAPSPVSNVSVPPLVESPMTPQQIAELQRRSQRQIEKGLEEMILRSPDVHLLSPVDVKFVNGVATINGLVTNNECKVKAGEILLAVPGVRQVQNLLATIEDEDKQ